MIKHRPAKISDCKFWWKIRNEKTVREVSFNTKSIPYATHKKWFEEKLKDTNSKLFIIFASNQKVGILWFGKNNSQVEISLALKSAARGKGVGTEAIKIGAKYALEKMQVNSVLAYTKPENLSSIKAFERAGFKNRGSITHKEQRAILLEFSG